MRAISLLYHDVVLRGEFDASGFPGGDAAIYKLELAEFQKHLTAIHSALQSPPLTVSSMNHVDAIPTLLTFDDGGASAHQYIADQLDRPGWPAHFFVTTNWIGKPGFLSAAQIRDLRARGHFIGSHSCSHPPRMSHCSREALQREWKNSIKVLEDILGERVDLASVPGGFYARNVAEEAAEAGIRTLFTSEPETAMRVVSGCVVRGRYTIQRGVAPATAAAIACGRVRPRICQFAYWNMKKLAKAAGGTYWLRTRRWFLAYKCRSQMAHEP